MDPGIEREGDTVHMYSPKNSNNVMIIIVSLHFECWVPTAIALVWVHVQSEELEPKTLND